MAELLPPQIPEPDKVFSRRRAWRGTKVGITTSLFSIASAIPTLALIEPSQVLSADTLTSLVISGSVMGGVGAIIDGFRPTSKVASACIEGNITAFKKTLFGLKENLSLVRQILSSPASKLSSDEIFAILASGVFYGALGGSLALPILSLHKAANEYVSDTVHSPLYSITSNLVDHPAETVFASTLMGVAIASAYLLFYKRTG